MSKMQLEMVALQERSCAGPTSSEVGEWASMGDEQEPQGSEQDRLIQEIIELQRAFYFENKGRDSERRRRLRDIIERSTAAGS
jgi:hypothetical protein